MKDTVNQNTFIHRFDEIGRGNNFSYEGRIALFEHYEQYEKETGTEIEFDAIAICCEFTEYESWEDFKRDYTGTATSIEEDILPEFEEDDTLTKDDYLDELIDKLRYYTIVIELDGNGFIIQSF